MFLMFGLLSGMNQDLLLHEKVHDIQESNVTKLERDVLVSFFNNHWVNILSVDRYR